MRIVTWNCYKGYPNERFARLSALKPDICILQECAKPLEPLGNNVCWFGDNPRKGVAVLAGPNHRLTPWPLDQRVEHSTYPVVLTTPDGKTIHILAVWSKPKPTYVSAIAHGLNAYRDFLRAAPSIVVGDFNSHSRWDKKGAEWTHSRLVEHLRHEFGLVSAVHSKYPSEPEPPTIYFQWKEDRPYHIDYCFVPEAWTGRISTVEVGSYLDFQGESDHRPVMVEIAD